MFRFRRVLFGGAAVTLAGLIAACESGTELPTSTSDPGPVAQNTPAPAPSPSPSPSAAPNQPPRLDASVNPDQGSAPLEVRFNLCRSTDPDGDTLSFDIEFGDGGRTGRCQETHTYAEGVYTASLAVRDGKGGLDERNVRVTVERQKGTPPPKPYYKLDSVAQFTWANELDVAGAAAQIRLNDGPEFFPARGYSHAIGEARRGDNVVSGRLLRTAGRPGSWRFDLGQNSTFVSGSVKAVTGTVEEITSSSITFRMSGRAEEAVAFRFRASR
jgi:PKD repeat protein